MCDAGGKNGRAKQPAMGRIARQSMFRIVLAVSILAVVPLTACASDDDGAESPAGATTWVTMEGQTWSLGEINTAESTVTFEGDEARFYLTADGVPVSVNFNVSMNRVLESGPATYALPEANQPNIVIDLSFFNRERPGSRMKRRLIFSEGTIDIAEIATNRLRMTYKGAGHPLMDQATFPIEGAVDVELPPR